MNLVAEGLFQMGAGLIFIVSSFIDIKGEKIVSLENFKKSRVAAMGGAVVFVVGLLLALPFISKLALPFISKWFS